MEISVFGRRIWIPLPNISAGQTKTVSCTATTFGCITPVGQPAPAPGQPQLGCQNRQCSMGFGTPQTPAVPCHPGMNFSTIYFLNSQFFFS